MHFDFLKKCFLGHPIATYFFMFLFVSFLSSPFSQVVAQHKIAYVDVEEAVQSMPEYQKIKSKETDFKKELYYKSKRDISGFCTFVIDSLQEELRNMEE